MIKNSTGERVEKKSMVCTECITLMTPIDFTTNDGKCQLCRGGTSGQRLYVIAFTYEYSEEPHLAAYIDDDYNRVMSRFREEHDDVEDYDVNEITSVAGYDIVVSHRN